jgi:hypothetical protein
MSKFQARVTDGPPGRLNAAESPPPGGRRLRLALRIAQVRLRFPAVLLVAFVVVGKWDVLRNYFDKLTRGNRPAVEAVSPDTEYWCPMCPGVVADWPGKCPVCNMTLVRRQRGEAVPLPDGVLARMQLSPYRVQLAGIRTAAVTYRPLVHETVKAGLVEATGPPGVDPDPSRLWLRADAFDRDLPFLPPGRAAEVVSEALPGRAPFVAKVRRLGPRPAAEGGRLQVWFEIADPGRELRPALFATVTVRVPAADIEPFRTTPTNAPPLRPGELRTVYVCPDHPDDLHRQPGRCPADNKELEARPLADNQRLRWWCPMHPAVTDTEPGGDCRACGGMKLVPAVLTYRPPGEVLAVPESAVVDTGTKRLVYVERAPGMFDGVEVIVGPRCGDEYPVIRGLEAGHRVATAGAFLIDAETRLNPSLAAGYFGAAQGGRPAPAPPTTPPPQSGDLGVEGALQKLSTEDRALAARQKVCPVTGEPLGSMGVPVRVVVAGRVVFVCCKGCVPELQKVPEKYLSRKP